MIYLLCFNVNCTNTEMSGLKNDFFIVCVHTARRKIPRESNRPSKLSSVARQPDSPSQPSPGTSNFINPHQFPNGNNPKPGASSNNSPSKSGSLSQKKDTKPGVRQQTAAPDPPMGRRRSPCPSADHVPLSSDPSQNSISENEPLRCSMTLPEHPNQYPKRNTSSAWTQNRFSVLENLSED